MVTLIHGVQMLEILRTNVSMHINIIQFRGNENEQYVLAKSSVILVIRAVCNKHTKTELAHLFNHNKKGKCLSEQAYYIMKSHSNSPSQVQCPFKYLAMTLHSYGITTLHKNLH
jgi:hypothetical protein